MKLDLDLSDLEGLEPELKRILKEFVGNGYSIFNDDSVNRRIARSGTALRKTKVLIMSNDRRTNTNVLSLNYAKNDWETILKMNWDKLVKELKK